MQYDVIVRSRLQSADFSMFMCTPGATALVKVGQKLSAMLENYAILSRDLEHGDSQLLRIQGIKTDALAWAFRVEYNMHVK